MSPSRSPWPSRFFFVQALLVPLWWWGLAMSPGFRAAFLTADAFTPEFRALIWADVLVLAAGSGAAGVSTWRHSPRASTWAWIVAGASAYATVYTVAWSAATGAPVLSPVSMLASTVVSVWCARHVV